MRGFQQVGHLMHDNVFQVPLGLLGKLGVQPDRAQLCAAAPPSSLHLSYRESLYADLKTQLPGRDQWRSGVSHQVSMPPRDDLFTLLRARTKPSVKVQYRRDTLDTLPSITLDDLEWHG